MTAAPQPEPRLDRGSRVTDGQTVGVVWRVEHVPADIGRGAREDVYVLWLPNLPEKEER